MKVLYDHAAFCKERRGGISKYFSQLVTSVRHFGCEPLLPFMFVTSEHYTSNRGSAKILLPDIRGQYRLSDALNCLMMPNVTQAQVWHSTYYNGRLLPMAKSTRMIATIHDMIPELFPSLYEDNPHREKHAYVDAASHIIAVSHSTKRDMVRHYNIASDKVSVIHHGIDLADLSFSPLTVPDRYVLFLGRRSGYKNFENLLIAWTMIEASRPDLHLVCIGADAFSKTELQFLADRKIKNVRHLRATDTQVRFAFKRALLFVYPSWYEGFGMPLLEAMANDCPMAISDASCFPEVAHDAAVYFDPTAPGDIAEKILHTIGDARLLQVLAGRGRSLVKDYAIEAMSSATAALYQRVAE